MRYRERGGVDVFTQHARFVAPRRCSRSTASSSPPATSSWRSAPGRSIPRDPGPRHGRRSTPPTRSCASTSCPPSMIIVGGGVHRRGDGSRLLELRHRRHDPAAQRAAAHGRGRRRLDPLHRAGRAPDARPAPGPPSTAVAPGPGARRDGRRGPTPPARASSVTVELLLVATGRVPNTDRLDAVAGGLELDEHGHLVVDAVLPHQRRRRVGIRRRRQPLPAQAHGERRDARRAPQPARIPTTCGRSARRWRRTRCSPSPQIASVGMTEAEARGVGPRRRGRVTRRTRRRRTAGRSRTRPASSR